jgi:hypothetical protein
MPERVYHRLGGGRREERGGKLRCSLCRKWKFKREFWKHPSRPGARSSRCKGCQRSPEHSDYMRDWQRAHKKSGKNCGPRAYTERRRLTGLMHNRLRRGALIKPTKCPLCGRDDLKIFGTVLSFEPFGPCEVLWRCSQCNGEAHRMEATRHKA